MFVIGAFFEKVKPKYGHETSAILIIGIAFSIIYYFAHGITPEDYQLWQFKPDVFFDAILPPIVFNAGFNMKRKKFFANLGNILVTGLGVTFVCFFLYSLATWAVINGTEVTMTRYTNVLDPSLPQTETLPVKVPMMSLLLFTSLLCSSDVVAAVSIVDYNAQPKLYSCIFGEGVVNDIVSIVLFNTVENLQDAQFTGATPFIIIAQFISLAVVSLSIGIVFGFACCLMFKHMRFLSVSVVTETFLMTAFGFAAYFVAALIKILKVEMSGIISLLTFAIIQAHYTWYNLSPQGKATTSVTYEFLGKTAEAAVYCYVGISLYTCIPEYWSFGFIAWQFSIIVVGRIIGVIGTFYLFRLCFRKKTIAFKELLFIVYGGMIRGAIAFALVLKISHTCPIPGATDCYEDDIFLMARSTTLIVVLLTTLIFGTFMKAFQGCVLGTPDERETFADVHEGRATHYEEIMHPNFDRPSEIEGSNVGRKTYLLGAGGEEGGFPNSRFAKWFAEFDENKIRPFLIRNYTLEAVETMDQLNELFTKNFDDKEPDEVQARLEDFDRKTRVLSVVNQQVRQTLAVRKSTVADIRASNLGNSTGKNR